MLPTNAEIVQPSVPPTTTRQEDLTVAGQRKVNLIWEYTQSVIAITVVMATLGDAVYLSVIRPGTEVPSLLAAIAGTIVGFYFARTNHQAIGGIGPKANETQPYEGR